MKIPKLPAVVRLSLVTLSTLALPVHAASDVWISGVEGNYSDVMNWVGGSIPNGADQTAEVNGAGSIVNFGPSDTVELLSLGLSIPTTGGVTPVFNQTGGTLTVGSLLFGGGGGSRNPTYNLSGGTLNISTAFTWGNGSNANFNVTGGTVNYSGAALGVGKDGAKGTIAISSGTFNHTGTGGQLRFGDAGTGVGNLILTGGAFNTTSNEIRIGAGGGTTGNVTLSGAAQFNAQSLSGTRSVYLGNNSGTGNLTMSGTSQFNAADYLFVVAQFGDKTSTLTISEDAVLTASSITVGNFNAASAANGIINLNGGTIVAGSIGKGNSSLVPSETQNVLHADGGTVRASAASGNYFSGFGGALYVDLKAGGLTFDTNGNDVTISNGANFAGVGGFTKTGEGVLIFTGASVFTGATIVNEGTLAISSPGSLTGSSQVEVAGGATLQLLHEASLNDTIRLTLNTGSTVDLSFVGTETIGILEIDGVVQEIGTYSLTQLQNLAGGVTFTGLDEAGLTVAVPEPSTVALLAATGLGMLIVARRRRCNG